jgi:hypothetical protein
MKEIWFITRLSRLLRVWAESAITRGDRLAATARRLADLAKRFGHSLSTTGIVAEADRVDFGFGQGVVFPRIRNEIGSLHACLNFLSDQSNSSSSRLFLVGSQNLGVRRRVSPIPQHDYRFVGLSQVSYLLTIKQNSLNFAFLGNRKSVIVDLYKVSMVVYADTVGFRREPIFVFHFPVLPLKVRPMRHNLKDVSMADELLRYFTHF